VEVTNTCSKPGCDQHSDTIFGPLHLCLEHFIDNCYRDLERMSQNRRIWAVDEGAWESANRDIQECAQKVALLSGQISEITNLQRARLLDIALWAAESAQQVRRSPRSSITIAIKVTSKIPGRFWEEATHTLDLSRHGARMKCRNAVETSDVLQVVRTDTGRRMQARVVWQRRTAPETHEIGIEFIDGEDITGS
jgi:hypothetical protein